MYDCNYYFGSIHSSEVHNNSVTYPCLHDPTFGGTQFRVFCNNTRPSSMTPPTPNHGTCHIKLYSDTLIHNLTLPVLTTIL